MTKILNQNVLAHIYLVDIKFKHQENTYRVQCDYYSDTGVENIDVYKDEVWLTPFSNKEIYNVATEVVYDLDVKQTWINDPGA